ncbi:MAG: hypothetical protein ACD_76C00053G0005 [uncultured bacterium]|nr:MAG: hypothetical protein ACD_76C00053G0005 [uncultured bacterium]HBD05631.1 hypothetical protein [Candidatus Uhrbacteria bacterium]
MQNTGALGENRIFEMIPGILVWVTFLFAGTASFVWPVGAIVFILVFDLYWLFRVTYFNIFLIVSWKRFRWHAKQDWFSRLQEMDYRKIYHIIFLPTYKEDIEVIRATLKSIESTVYPKDRMMIVLAGEEGDSENFKINASAMQAEFGSVFSKFIITEHPSNLSGEIPGKGSNLNWAGERVKEIIDSSGINYEDIIASALDIDTIVPSQFFAYLSFLYLTTPNPTMTSYQPVAMFNNNIWSSPAPIRIAAFGTTFWLMTELARPERLWTFSSHSMPFKMLVDVGFWQKDIVSEDSRIFLQGFLKYNGNYRVTPMYLPVSLDAVSGATYREGLSSLYRQQRRWAWGVEHTPFLFARFCAKNSGIPFWKRVRLLFNQIEGMYTWATAPVLIFFLGWLPLFVADNNQTAFVSNAPFTLRSIMQLATIGVMISALLGSTLLPPRPKNTTRFKWPLMFLQWILVPVTFVLFGAVPAIDAQTRLMFGKYLGFNVTKKIRKGN